MFDPLSLSLSLFLSFIFFIYFFPGRHQQTPPALGQSSVGLIKSSTGVNVVLLLSELFIREISELMNQDIEPSPRDFIQKLGSSLN